MRRLNKRGSEMTIGTLVIIVLAIIVLVVLVLGFGTGWTNLWSKISGYFSTSNVDTIKSACQRSCDNGDKFEYCCSVNKVVTAKGAAAQLMLCDNGALIPSCDSVSCNRVNDCKIVMCAPDMVKAKSECDTIDAGKTLDSTGTPINADKTCCKTLKTANTPA